MNDLAHRLNRSVELDNDAAVLHSRKPIPSRLASSPEFLVPLLAPAWVEG